MTDKRISVNWYPLKKAVETVGHMMPDGWWYIYLPFDHHWHFVEAANVTEL